MVGGGSRASAAFDPDIVDVAMARGVGRACCASPCGQALSVLAFISFAASNYKEERQLVKVVL